ncbi:MAG TPA: 50S ribosomal protein L13 [Gemmataceae bacterium]|jgi:large subunit ribosomal protein L13|nr:50S ribosomal protein L13 [Gemmataceae bacterium]
MLNKTTLAKPATVQQDWLHIDATDVAVGRLAVQIATILRGKHKPTFTPHIDTGDFVIVTNVEKIKFTGNKWEQKTYQTYSRYPGGQKIIPAKVMRDTKPEEVLYQAVKRMVPRNRLGRAQMNKLKIYAGTSHPHQAQQPKEFKVS